MSIILMLRALVCSWSIFNYSGVKCCRKVEDMGSAGGKIRMIASTTAMIRVAFPPSASSIIDLTTEDALGSLVIVLDPPLVQGEDFELFSLARENALPAQYRRSKKMYVGLRLLPGKSWVQGMDKSSQPVPLYLVSVHVCQRKENVSSITSDSSTWTQLVSVVHRKQHCPSLSLPGASRALSSFLASVLSECQMPRMVKSSRLDWRKANSFTLLSMQPPLMLVDGSDASLTDASRAVDNFLAAHSVLEIAWEPYAEWEPRWWVLVPRPAGMPGHLFAMLDVLQWNHPLVADAQKYLSQPLCNETIPGCVPGCPQTKIKGITGSGWGADSGHVVDAFRRFYVDFTPMQAAPFRLGYRYTPPLWGGTIGWLYTYQGCATNFLECYFLSHSPCPVINMDTSGPPGLANVYKQRFESNSANHGWSRRPAWWSNVMGAPSARTPEFTISDLWGGPADHTFYSYFFRPMYHLRKIVHERVTAFNLSEQCAVMHVRRGDSIMHTGQARAYLRIDTYVRAGRPLMDAMGIKTVFLVTDSKGAVEEAQRCAAEHADACGGISFRYLDKKRWVGAEGGWENPFPSGDSRTELLDIQLEFALAQKCSMLISGDSNYANKISSHMCCGYPLAARGELPHRCVCPPVVRLEQHGFDCKKGNKLLCEDPTGNLKGGDITRPLNDPSNMLAARLSLESSAFIQATNVCLKTPISETCYNPTQSKDSQHHQEVISRFVVDSLSVACGEYDNSIGINLGRRSFCK